MEVKMARNREVVRNLIKLADTVEEADGILNGEYSSTSEKLAYLRGMFNVDVLSGHDKNIESDYKAALSAVINEKWRA
jgi:hypothetical protein